jgi:hypothetical protein
MKVLSALHDSIPVRFGHLQEKIMRVGRTIYVADLRSFSSTVDTVSGLDISCTPKAKSDCSAPAMTQKVKPMNRQRMIRGSVDTLMIFLD